jgi:hypothetical protein
MLDTRIAPFEIQQLGRGRFQATIADIDKAVRAFVAEHRGLWGTRIVINCESIDYWFDLMGVPFVDPPRPKDANGVRLAEKLIFIDYTKGTVRWRNMSIKWLDTWYPKGADGERYSLEEVNHAILGEKKLEG